MELGVLSPDVKHMESMAVPPFCRAWILGYNLAGIATLGHGVLGTCTRAEADFGWLNSAQAPRCGSAVQD